MTREEFQAELDRMSDTIIVLTPEPPPTPTGVDEEDNS